MFCKVDRYLLWQSIKRRMGTQSEKEREEEVLWRESRENARHIANIFGIGWKYRIVSWWKHKFLHALGLHKSLIESIREGFGPAPICSCGKSLVFIGMCYGATSDDDYLEWECPECDR